MYKVYMYTYKDCQQQPWYNLAPEGVVVLVTDGVGDRVAVNNGETVAVAEDDGVEEVVDEVLGVDVEVKSRHTQIQGWRCPSRLSVIANHGSHRFT